LEATEATVEVESKVVGKTVGGHAAGLSGGGDTVTSTVTFIVGAKTKWAVTGTAKELKYAQLPV
jgi:predicted alpha/beta hydrolase